MQGRDCVIHGEINRATLRLIHPCQALIPKHAALNTVHDVKGSAENRFVFAKSEHSGYRHIGLGQRMQNPVLAFNGVR